MDDLATPFHAGELAVQEKLGVRQMVHNYAPRFVRSYLPDQHRELLETLPFLVVGSIDRAEQPTASILFGLPGFIRATSDTALDIAAFPTSGDPLRENLQTGSPLGFLAIEFETRRRNRMAGKVTGLTDDGFSVSIDQTFGNCPQYIQSRSLSYGGEDPQKERRGRVTQELSEHVLADRLKRADTFFIASSHFKDADDAKHGVDVSHRGGKPGFLKLKDGVITFPDFRGNNHFNTFGNIALNPKVGLLVPDFDTGDMLYIHGEAEIVWDGPEVAEFEGALRLVKVRITSTRLAEGATPAHWRFNDYSPSLAATGSWAQETRSNEDRLWRQMRIDRVERESSMINSFYLTAPDGEPLEKYKAGQHLPVRIPGKDGAIRTYTISKAPGGKQYRLSIKREARGTVSRHFHDEIRVGDKIDAMSPGGMFHLGQHQKKPLVLVSGGVGITPMIAMLEEVVNKHGDKEGGQCDFPIVFIHATRSGEEHAFKDHPILKAPHDFGVKLFYAYSDPTPQDIVAKAFDLRGRLDKAALADLLPAQDSDVYLCGPAGFMGAMRDVFTELGVPDAQIKQEAFGPAGDAGSTDAPNIEVQVTLQASGKEINWNPSEGSLLEAAERAGTSAPFSCRTGSCGTCVTKILKGKVNHPKTAQYVPSADEALICCALPNSEDQTEKLVLDL